MNMSTIVLTAILKILLQRIAAAMKSDVVPRDFVFVEHPDFKALIAGSEVPQ
jgi:hypothetical protein